MKRVMFYCQHLLGMGHLVRSAEIVRALARDSSVLFVTGGEIPQGFPIPKNVKHVQLIPLKSNLDFSNLLLCDFSWDLEETKAIRRGQLLHAFDEFQPDILVTELFPFGRKQFAFELLPLLQRARAQGAFIVSSIRDILVTKTDQAKHEQRVCELVNNFYDLVLVHGDEKFQKLDQTFSRVGDLRCPVAYTGYVVQQQNSGIGDPSASDVTQSQKPTIVVSNGSGKCPSGHLLLESVLRAAPRLQRELPHQFLLFAGPLIPDAAYEGLQSLACLSENVTLVRYTSDLPGQLRRADLSISMAGYNTVMDILSAGVRALVYPVTGNDDQEQPIRAAKLASLGVLGVLSEEQLVPERLAQKIRDGLRSKPCRIHFDCTGAHKSAVLLQKYLSIRNDCLPSIPCASGQRVPWAAAATV